MMMRWLSGEKTSWLMVRKGAVYTVVGAPVGGTV